MGSGGLGARTAELTSEHLAGPTGIAWSGGRAPGAALLRVSVREALLIPLDYAGVEAWLLALRFGVMDLVGRGIIPTLGS